LTRSNRPSKPNLNRPNSPMRKNVQMATSDATKNQIPAGKERFFKYTSATTAVKILETAAVRYSSPLLFNDPFDIQSGLHFPFDTNALPEKILGRMKELIGSDSRPPVNEEDPWGEAILLAWKLKGKVELPESFLRPFLESLRDRMLVYRDQTQAYWGEFLLPRLRVFSVCEEYDNLLMWSHYAQKHTGVVLALRVMPEKDNPLCVAQPVIYCSAPPPLFTEEEWIGFNIGTNDLEPNEQLFRKYAYFKSDIWSYEKEWRAWSIEPEIQEKRFSDYSLYENELEAVYLGCRMDSGQRQSVIELVAAKYPRTQIFQAYKPIDEYQLHFQQI
jgi:Protein of unknown function (DUF2971)